MAAVEVTRIVFNSLYEAGFLEHLKIIFGALRKALGFEEFVVTFKEGEAFFVFGFDGFEGFFELIFWCGVVGIWEDVDVVWSLEDIASEWIDNLNVLQCIKIKFKTITVFAVGWEKIDGVAADAEVAALKSEVVSVILHIYEHIDEVRLRDWHGVIWQGFVEVVDLWVN